MALGSGREDYLVGKISPYFILKHHSPGTHVLKAAISLYKPRPHTLIPATRNLKAVPGCNSTFRIPLY